MKNRRAGHTLLETTLSLSLLLLLAGGTLSLLRDSGEVFGESVRQAADRREVDGALASLARELEQASRTTVVIDRTAPEGDSVKFQLPLDLAGAAVTLGATLRVDGEDRPLPGATIAWKAVGGVRGPVELHRQVIAADGVTLVADEIACPDLDFLDAAGNRGFSVQFDGRIASVTLRSLPRLETGAPDLSATRMGRTQLASVRLRSN